MPNLRLVPGGAPSSPASQNGDRHAPVRGHFLICACGRLGCGVARRSALHQLAAVFAFSGDVNEADRFDLTSELTDLADRILFRGREVAR